MGWGETQLLQCLLTGAVGFVFLMPAVWIVQRLIAGKDKRKAIGKVISFSVCLFCAMWSLRLGLECFAAMSTAGQNPKFYEAFVSSMMQTLDAFGGDNDYMEHLQAVRDMIGTLAQQDESWLGFWSIWVTLLEFLAPIASGAIILEAVASVFPRFRLWLLRKAFWKTKFYFSQLNEGSLTLAESITQIKHRLFCNPVIIFANVDPAETPEATLLGAKRAGAFCLEEDILHVNKKGCGGRKYFLIGQEEENLQQLVGLAEDGNSKYLLDAEVYLFCQSDAYNRIEQSVCEKLRQEEAVSQDRLPVIIPVRPYRNLIVEMLIALPLYEPLLHKAPGADGMRDLSVTILGTGTIGTEMFLNTYWIGQMLDCRLTVNLVSRESEDSFWGRMDTINPEIRRTLDPGDPILQIDRKGTLAQPYCTVNYICCDIHQTQFTALMEPKNGNGALLATDYFFVALGADTDNIEVANAVRRAVGEYHVCQKTDKKTVIAYVVYDSELASALNRKKHYTSAYQNGPDIYMQAVGAHTQVYSAESVFMTQQEPLAQKLDKAYLSKKSEKDRAKDTGKRINEDYNHWSSRARAAHRKYKIFSMGVRHQSVFEAEGHESAGYLASVREANAQTACRVWADTKTMSPQALAEHTRLMDRMAWLEHRRWNAFLRVYGFRCSRDYAVYADPNVPKSYKNQDMKLHPCLLECDDRGIQLRKQEKKTGKGTGVTFVCDDPEALDLLDELSCTLAQGGYNDYDFKIYDYPDCDFSKPE